VLISFSLINVFRKKHHNSSLKHKKPTYFLPNTYFKTCILNSKGLLPFWKIVYNRMGVLNTHLLGLISSLPLLFLSFLLDGKKELKITTISWKYYPKASQIAQFLCWIIWKNEISSPKTADVQEKFLKMEPYRRCHVI
jgi:hypothetical protein